MIVEATILFNLLITLYCVWVAMIINSRFLRPSVLNKKRFAIYELRDKLALLAMRGVIEERSEEYVTLLKLMNSSLSSTKEFRITRFMKQQSMILNDKKLREHLDNILEKIRNKKMPKEYQEIVADFFVVAREIYEHKTWLLSYTLMPLILLFTLLAFVIRAARRVRNFLQYQKSRVDNIEHELDINVSRFA